jgi:hypothetical protein
VSLSNQIITLPRLPNSKVYVNLMELPKTRLVKVYLLIHNYIKKNPFITFKYNTYTMKVINFLPSDFIIKQTIIIKYDDTMLISSNLNIS